MVVWHIIITYNIKQAILDVVRLVAPIDTHTTTWNNFIIVIISTRVR